MTLQDILAPSRATVFEDHVTIHDMTLFDPQVVRALSEYAQRTASEDVGDQVQALIELGAKAAALGIAAVDVDQIRRSLEMFTSDVANTAKASVTDIRQAVSAATDAETGTIATVVGATLERFGEEVTAIVGGEDAPIRVTVQKAVQQVSDKTLGEIQRVLTSQSEHLRTMLATDNPNSPINTLKVELIRSEHETRQEVMKALQELTVLVEVAKATRAAMERSAVKGFDYEHDAIAAVTDLALVAGDTIEATGAMVGAVARSKKGDAVITLSSATARRHDVKIVVETKDMALTCDGWKRELEEGRKNRSAIGALGIVRSPEKMPGQRRVVIFDPLNVVIAYDPQVDRADVLYTAYQLLRTQAACTILDGDEDGLDVAAVKSHVEAALTLLDDFDKIEKSAGSARKNLDDLSKMTEKLRFALDRQVRGALTLLDGAQPTS